MLPTIEERLDSIIRALSTVVLAGLAPEARLAREQVQLSIGHLGILRDHIALLPQFEREEAEDAAELAAALLGIAGGGAATRNARAALAQAMFARAGMPASLASRAINAAIAGLVEAAFLDGDKDSRASLLKLVTQYEKERSNKDREIFYPYGFDAL